MAFVKFVSEMTPDEMVPVVFGQNYKTDANGDPIEQGLGSDAYWQSAKDEQGSFRKPSSG